MVPSSGQSLRTVCLRVIGTTLAMILSIVIYYIVDGYTAGIIVFLFIVLAFETWIIVRFPTKLPIGLTGAVTLIITLGYELQVRKLGIERATSNGQAFYPIYVLAPIRLATVTSGLILAFIFSIFPYPTSEHGQLRHDLGSAFYLVANYYSVSSD